MTGVKRQNRSKDLGGGSGERQEGCNRHRAAQPGVPYLQGDRGAMLRAMPGAGRQ